GTQDPPTSQGPHWDRRAPGEGDDPGEPATRRAEAGRALPDLALRARPDLARRSIHRAGRDGATDSGWRHGAAPLADPAQESREGAGAAHERAPDWGARPSAADVSRGLSRLRNPDGDALPVSER